MLKNYLKIAVRNLLKHKSYGFINISGLVVGIACFVLIMLYAQDELSYDRFHQNADRIYRVITSENSEGRWHQFANAYGPLAPAMAVDFPEIERIVRLFPYEGAVETSDERQFQEKRFFFADSAFFEVFSFSFLRGDPKSALLAPHSLVLTESTARRYFGDRDPIGEVLRLEGKFDFNVTAVVEDPPGNSHFHFDFLVPYQNLRQVMGWNPHWYWPPVYTYVLLPDDVPPKTIENRFPQFISKNIKGLTENDRAHFLQPLRDIHLNPGLENEIEPAGSRVYIYLFSAIACFILLIACINFMNLATARSANRAREVGLRKVVGAQRAQLIKQFIGESLVYAGLATLLSLVLVELMLPTFNGLVDKQVDVNYLQNWPITLGLLTLTILVGLIAGSYPALFLSRFRPLQVLQNQLFASADGKGAARFRSALVVLQFTISIALIIVTLVVNNQLRYAQNKRLGFNKEHIVVIPLRDENVQGNYATFKNSLLAYSNVRQATVLSNFPWQTGFYGFNVHAEDMREDAEVNFPVLLVDHDFVRTFEMEVVAGRDFAHEFSTDRNSAFILNETAVKRLGWTTPVQKKFTVKHIASGQDVAGRVIGVVQDFHFQSLHHGIEPLALLIAPADYYVDNLAVRIEGRDIARTLAFLEQKWREFAAERPFRYFFLDEDFDALYKSEEKLSRIYRSFALLAIFIACLGLFGLASFAAEQRTKEIGVRKVLGATASGIVGLLSRDFVKLVLVANVIAWPAAWFAMNKWLQNFAYRVELSWWVFALAGSLALLIALLTVGTQAIKAALANPVESLRYE